MKSANAFISRILPEERARPEDTNVNIRLNKEWQVALSSFKKLTGQENDGTAFKLALEIANNVLHSLFSDKIRAELSLGRQPKTKGSAKKRDLM